MKDRKRKDEHTNNNRFSFSFVEQSIQGIVILQDFRIIYANQVFADICGYSIDELVTNSLKHAFPDGQSGEILVRLHTNNNGKMALEVSDAGVGFPDGSNIRKPDTLGLQLVNDLVNQLGGIIELDQTRGTAFRIAFDRTQDAE